MYTAISVIFLTLHILFALLIVFLCISFVTGGPFVPSKKKSVAAMIDIARIKPGMTVYDLGSGDGRILREAARRGVRAVGVEMNPFLVLWTLIAARGKNISVKWQSLWKTNISKADVVFVYLLPWHMKKLEQKLKSELRPGALVVSNSFIFPNWKPLRQNAQQHVYVFQVRK